MYSNNNINTGLASKMDAFRFNTDNKSHVIGVKTSAPDFSIPPTPASSYQNIHVVLDTIHPSSVVTTTQVLSGPTEILSVNSTPTSYMGYSNRSFSSLPNAPLQNNKLDDVPTRTSRLTPERVDPDQPMARSDAALTSLKSEIAPQTPGFVGLDEVDELAERKDRNLPASVDLSLYDETESFSYRSQQSKEWALMEEDERSWRMSRPISESWSSKWDLVQRELLGGFSGLAALEEQERSWRMSRGVDSTWLAQWKQVGREILTFNSTLDELSNWANGLVTRMELEANRMAKNINSYSSSSFSIDAMEEGERQWRMSRPIDRIWAAQWKEVGREITAFNLNFDDLTNWAKGLSADIEKQVDQMVQNITSLGESINARTSYLELDAMEEKERKWRSTRGVDPVFYGQWHLVGEEIKSVVGLSWSEWFTNIKERAYLRTSKAVDRLEHMQLPEITLPSLPSVSLPEISLPSVTLPSVALPDLKIGVTKSEATTPMYNDSELVDFTFRSRRVPQEIIELEEIERQDRISRGVNAVAYGLWFRAGLELQYRFSLQPTFAKYGESIVEKASSLADKAIDTFGSLVDSAQAAIASAEESLTPIAPTEFAEHKHLNYFAFSAEKVDFTFKSRRTPAYIIALEEAERIERSKRFQSNRMAYKRWNSFLLANLPQSNIEKAEGVFMQAVHKAEHGVSGFFGSIAHALHIGEKAPVQVEDAKVDPMTAARVGRVNDELLHLTVKSV